MKELYMKNYNGEKIFSLEYDKETLRDLVLDKQEEIERLHSIIKEAREEIRILVTNSDIADYQAQKLFQILDKVEEN